MKQDQTAELKKVDFKLREGIYLGALLSPADVKKATAGVGTALPGALHRWTLCGDIDPTIFSMLEASGYPQQENERLTVLAAASGLHYAVFTHQAGPFQHRYVAPLFDHKVANCVRAVAHGDALGYSLAGDGPTAAVWAASFGVREFQPLLPMCKEASLGLGESALREYVDTVLELRDPRRIPSSLEGVAVKLASVSAVAPEQLIEKLAAHHYIWK
ncbi:hypothetical protein [Hydrogenophaga sp.]|uniref:hypothetical protein n=1 Tax=Hydrogenophaga sp. TaxID=1904254 RepID=UPI0025BAA742|nr:hypothetical protein [Hydrogenophaga sp.]